MYGAFTRAIRSRARLMVCEGAVCDGVDQNIYVPQGSTNSMTNSQPGMRMGGGGTTASRHDPLLASLARFYHSPHLLHTLGGHVEQPRERRRRVAMLSEDGLLSVRLLIESLFGACW